MKIGFLGAGNMAGAILQGLLEKGFTQGANIMISRRDPAKRVELAKNYGVLAADSNVHLVKACDIIVLAGKGHEDYQEIEGKKYPFDERVVIREILDSLKK